MRLAEAGLNIALVGRKKETESQIELVAKCLESDYGVRTQIYYADLSNRKETYQVLESTKDLDVGLLIASAGFGTSGELIHANIEEELNMLDVNCSSLLMFTQYFGKRFASRKR